MASPKRNTFCSGVPNDTYFVIMPLLYRYFIEINVE